MRVRRFYRTFEFKLWSNWVFCFERIFVAILFSFSIYHDSSNEYLSHTIVHVDFNERLSLHYIHFVCVDLNERSRSYWGNIIFILLATFWTNIRAKCACSNHSECTSILTNVWAYINFILGSSFWKNVFAHIETILFSFFVCLSERTLALILTSCESFRTNVRAHIEPISFSFCASFERTFALIFCCRDYMCLLTHSACTSYLTNVRAHIIIILVYVDLNERLR